MPEAGRTVIVAVFQELRRPLPKLEAVATRAVAGYAIESRVSARRVLGMWISIELRVLTLSPGRMACELQAEARRRCSHSAALLRERLGS